MGRNSMPDDYHADAGGVRRTVRGRVIAIALALVLALAAGTVVAARGGLLPFGSGCPDSDIALRVTAAPSIAPAVREVAGRAEDEQVRTAGRCLDVHVTAKPAADVAESLSRGGAEAERPMDVWLPDSTVWPDAVSAAEHGAQVDSTGPVASSPIGLAAVPRAAEALGWPEKTYTWSDLAGAAAGDGRLRVGSADPARSATGLLALSFIDKSSSRKGADSATLTATAAKQLSQRVQPGDEAVLSTLPHDGSATELGNPKRNQALIVSEQAAYAHNDEVDAAPGLKMFYPKDGAAALDYPYTTVDGDSMGPDRTRAASRFQTLLGGTDGVETLRSHGFRPANGQDEDAVVRGAGGAPPQPVSQDPAPAPGFKETQAVLGMWTITVQSARLTTVVDASSSMAQGVPGRRGQTRMDVTKAALIQGLSQFTGEDEIGLWRFSTRLDGDRDYEEVVRARRLADRVGGVTQRNRLTDAFGGLQPVVNGATGLYDTTLAAYGKARDGYASGKFNALVILTDGANEDPGSVSKQKLVGKLKGLADPERPVALIMIAIGPDADKTSCAEVAKAVDGASYQVTDPADINTVLLEAIMDSATLGER